MYTLCCYIKGALPVLFRLTSFRFLIILTNSLLAVNVSMVGVNMFIDFSKMLIVRDIEAPQIPPPHSHTGAHVHTSW